MNTYLLGYAPVLNRKLVSKYENNEKLQRNWIKRNVNYYYQPKPDKSPWVDMLEDLVFKYYAKIHRTGEYRLVIYFHNLDYDAQHFFQEIVTGSLHGKVVINKIIYNASLYSVEFEYNNCVFELRDSMKLYNQSLANLGKSVGWRKQTDKATYEWFNLTDSQTKLEDEIFYFKFDIGVLSAVMGNHFNSFKGRAKLTAAAYAENGLKQDLKQYDTLNGTEYFKKIFEPKLTREQRLYIRSAYFGGFVYANRYLLNKKLKRGLVADVNSLYPSVMLNRNYPTWDSLVELTSTEFNRLNLADLNTFGIVTLAITHLKIHADGVPVIPKKEAFGNSREIYNLEDLGDDRQITVTTIDLYHIKNNYDIEFEYVTGMIATNYLIKPFAGFIEKHKKAKEEAKNKVDRMVAKIYLNSSYGKFAQRQILNTHILMKKDDGTIGYREVPEAPSNGYLKNILIAVWVTAFARDVLFKAIENIKQSKTATLWYCDTDAVHFGYTGKLNPVTDGKAIFEEIGLPYSNNIFGKWKPEQHMSEAVYLGSKRYWEQDPVAEQNFIKQCQDKGKPYTDLDVRKAGAIIKGAGIQKLGKEYLIKMGIDHFRYFQNKTLIVPFQASKKVVNGIKIFRTIKKIEPTEYQNKFI